MKNYVLLSIYLWSSLALSASSHEAHVHGEATLYVVLEENTLVIELTSPAANIVGFEHKPKNAAQKKAVADAIKQLKQTDVVFIIPSAAQCKAEEIEVESGLAEDKDDHHEEHGHKEHDDEETHSEFKAHYHFDCAKPAQLDRIEITLFKTFPGIESLEVQSIAKRGQQKKELNAANSILKL